MRKINDLKMTREKSNAFEKLNSFLDDVENAKMTKIYFLDFLCFSLFLEFFENISKTWVKNWVATVDIVLV